MEKRKLVRRAPDRRDRRISRLWLTKKGRLLQQEVVPSVEAFVGRMFACLSEQELNQLTELIRRLKAHLEELGPVERSQQKTFGEKLRKCAEWNRRHPGISVPASLETRRQEFRSA